MRSQFSGTLQMLESWFRISLAFIGNEWQYERWSLVVKVVEKNDGKYRSVFTSIQFFLIDPAKACTNWLSN